MRTSSSPARADSPPGVLKVGQMTSGFTPDDGPGIAVPPVDAAQHENRRIAEIHHLGAGFGVGKAQLARLQIDMLPAEVHMADISDY